MSLEKITPTFKSGNERLFLNEVPMDFSLLDFWRWSVSDILSNATRGRFAEFIVATATHIDVCTVRDEWSAFDLITPEGIKLEIKSAAYLQSWYQKALSKILFSTRRSLAWDSESNLQAKIATRSADIYVFCLLNHQTKATADPLNLDQWQFYVLSTRQIEAYSRSQHSITLKSLEKLILAVSYKKLRDQILQCYAEHNFSG
jgi:hypothetical protein